MLKTLRLENFQAHKDTIIEFSSGLTCIIGLNNHGKSAILRGARKVVRNEPEGSVFIRDGEKETRLTLTTDTGQVIRRVRNDGSEGANAYVISQAPKNVEFNKFGFDIPQEVLKYFESSELQVFGDVEYDLNFRTQFDNLFLTLGKGLASLRGKVLSKLTGIDKVQRAVQLAASEEKQLSMASKKILQQVAEATAALLPFENLDLQLAALEVIKQREDYITSAELYISNLKNLNSTLVEQTATIVNLSSIVKVLTRSFSDYVTAVNTTQAVLKLLNELNEIEIEIAIIGKVVNIILPDIQAAVRSQELETHLQEYSVILAKECRYQPRVAQTLPDTQDLSLVKTRVFQLQAVEQGWQQLDSAIVFCKASLTEVTSQLTFAEKELLELKAELQICPVCNKAF